MKNLEKQLIEANMKEKKLQLVIMLGLFPVKIFCAPTDIEKAQAVEDTADEIIKLFLEKEK